MHSGDKVQCAHCLCLHKLAYESVTFSIRCTSLVQHNPDELLPYPPHVLHLLSTDYLLVVKTSRSGLAKGNLGLTMKPQSGTYGPVYMCIY